MLKFYITKSYYDGLYDFNIDYDILIENLQDSIETILNYSFNKIKIKFDNLVFIDKIRDIEKCYNNEILVNNRLFKLKKMNKIGKISDDIYYTFESIEYITSNLENDGFTLNKVNGNQYCLVLNGDINVNIIYKRDSIHIFIRNWNPGHSSNLLIDKGIENYEIDDLYDLINRYIKDTIDVMSECKRAHDISEANAKDNLIKKFSRLLKQKERESIYKTHIKWI